MLDAVRDNIAQATQARASTADGSLEADQWDGVLKILRRFEEDLADPTDPGLQLLREQVKP
jgi:hypothetical protein